MLDTRTRIQLANVKDQEKTTWLALPFDENDLGAALKAIGLSLDEDTDESDSYDLVLSGEPPVPYLVKSWESDYLTEKHFSNIYEASDLVERIEGLDDYDVQKLDALIESGEEIEKSIDAIEDGEVDFYPNMDLTDVAQELGEEGLFSQEFLLDHVDWEAIGRDLSFDGYTEVSGGVLRRD